ncbi:MAG: YbaB/EbfC family nucleoid-associated protein [Chlorobi bacterium]|nr:YbaB/EbfC family nucleoid-associated protein [Chlorobiota bacterium]
MFDKIMTQMQEQAAQIKKRLDNTVVEAEAENGLVKITATGNKKILSIEINEKIAGNKETVEDFVILAVNKVLEKAEEIAQKETKSMAKNVLPDGLGNIFG